MFKSLTFTRSEYCCSVLTSYHVYMEGIFIGAISFDPSDFETRYRLVIDFPGHDTIQDEFADLNVALTVFRCTVENLCTYPVLIDRVSWIIAQIATVSATSVVAPVSPSGPRSSSSPAGLFNDELAITLDSDLSLECVRVFKVYSAVSFDLHYLTDGTVRRVNHGC